MLVDSRYTSLFVTLEVHAITYLYVASFYSSVSKSINTLAGMQVDPGDVVMVSPPLLFLQTVPASQ